MKYLISVWAAIFLFISITTSSVEAAPAAESYCLALRGNGELAPAHWGGLAQVIEKLGLPKAMSGGSSASISLFMLESIAQNQIVVRASPEEEREYASLFVKSLQAYLELVASRPEWQELASVAKYLKPGAVDQADLISWLTFMMHSTPGQLARAVNRNQSNMMRSFEFAMNVGVVNPYTLEPLISAISEMSGASSQLDQLRASARVQFFAGEIYRSVTTFGTFNAETDQNIFFRTGVINFEGLAENFGRVANFYSGRGMDVRSMQALQSFVRTCAPLARGKTWDELRKINPSCDEKFKSIAADYRNSGAPRNAAGRHLDRVGATIPTFPGTAILRDTAYAEAKSAMNQYPKALDPEFGKNFVVDDSDVSFGYWGSERNLARIEENLSGPFLDDSGRRWDFSKDSKSQKFYALGADTWGTVLSASPAEPGLAPLKEIKTLRGSVFSAGGWSDLHPGAVLKAFGCENIVYVTRRGGESLFGQGIAKRLLNFKDIPWEVLATDPARKPSNRIRNNNGDPNDMKSRWSRLYNLANPNSSFNQALQVFDSVVCTDWDRFDIKADNAVSDMIAEAYHAPWISRTTVKPEKNQVDPKLGYRPYAGCIPF